VLTVLEVERLLPADPAHGAGIGGVAALEQRRLADDRGGVDQPGDNADIPPGAGRVVEHVVELALAGDEVGEDLLARLPQVLHQPVEQLGMPRLVLDLRGHGELALERRRAQDPVALRQRAHDLGVGVHLDEADQPLAVLVGHPVARLDLATRLNRSLEFLDPLLFGHAAPPACSVLLPSPTRGEGPGVRGTSAPNAPSTIAAYWRANSSGGIGPAGSYH